MPATLIKAGSYSRLKVFSTCPHQAELKYINKIPENERPALPAGKEYPNDRGSRVHDYAEQFVRGTKSFEKLIHELKNFEKELNRLRDLFPTGRVMMEDMWYFNDAWGALPNNTENWSPDIWMRIMLDVVVFSPDGKTAIVIDYKTGKKYGNEVTHAEQTQLYALAVFLRFPNVEEVITELWYTDQDEMSTMEFTRKQGMRFLKNWNNKMIKMTTAVVFPTKANMYNCRWCPYKTGVISAKQNTHGTGDCDKNPT